jgi:hypothetical protein
VPCSVGSLKEPDPIGRTILDRRITIKCRSGAAPVQNVKPVQRVAGPRIFDLRWGWPAPPSTTQNKARA